MLLAPIICDICHQPSTVVAYEVLSRNMATCRMISALLLPRGTSGEARMSEITSCIMWRLSKMIATSGYRCENVGATAAVIGMMWGMVCGGFSSICRNRATVAVTPVCRVSSVWLTISGS